MWFRRLIYEALTTTVSVKAFQFALIKAPACGPFLSKLWSFTKNSNRPRTAWQTFAVSNTSSYMLRTSTFCSWPLVSRGDKQVVTQKIRSSDTQPLIKAAESCSLYSVTHYDLSQLAEPQQTHVKRKKNADATKPWEISVDQLHRLVLG